MFSGEPWLLRALLALRGRNYLAQIKARAREVPEQQDPQLARIESWIPVAAVVGALCVAAMAVVDTFQLGAVAAWVSRLLVVLSIGWGLWLGVAAGLRDIKRR